MNKVNSAFQKKMKQQAPLISRKEEQVHRRKQEEDGIAKPLNNHTVILELTSWTDCINLMMVICPNSKELSLKILRQLSKKPQQARNNQNQGDD